MLPASEQQSLTLSVDDDGHAVEADEGRLSDGAAVDRVRVALMVVSIVEHTMQLKLHVPRNTAKNGDRGAAGADGDVQVRDVDAEQGEDQALGGGRDIARVLDVLAALGRPGGGRDRGLGGGGAGGSGNGHEESEGSEELHVWD
jgi:hypothetical protein